MRTRPYAAGLAAVLTLTGAVAGCSSEGNTVSERANQGYISGDGSVERIVAADRREPVRLTGTLLDGSRFDLAGLKGKVVVVNVWASWCGPCVAEAPHLVRLWQAQRAKKANVAFLGIDFRESAAAGTAFADKVGMGYPSLSDEGGVSILALQGKAPTTPTTLVLDTQGRIAARISGVADPTVLSGLIDDTLAS